MNRSEADATVAFLPDFCNVQAVLFLVLVGELLAIVLSLASSGLVHFDWTTFARISLFVQWVVLPSGGLLCVLKRPLARLGATGAALVSYALILSVTAAASVAAQWFGPAGSGPHWRLDHFGRDLLISAVLAGIALRYLYLQQRLRLQQEAELKSRIDALQARIRPHFLFNSMNSIASLIQVNPDAAEEAVCDLSELFRASLTAGTPLIALADEIELCRRFVRIEQLRLGDRLRFRWEVPALSPSLQVPALSIQPLVENAIYHGIQPLAQGGEVVLAVSVGEDTCSVTIDNPRPAQSRAGGHRMALQNVHHRLQAIYGERAMIETDPGGERYRVSVRFPLAVEHSG